MSSSGMKPGPIGLNYFFFFAVFGLILPYLSPLLLEMEFSRTQIGWIQAAMAGILTVVPALAGRLTDRFSTARRTLKICGIGMFVCSAVMQVWSNWQVGFLAALMVFTLFRAPVVSMQDTLALAAGSGTTRTYSILRMIGSLGFAVTAILASYILKPGSYHILIPVLTILTILFALSNWLLSSEGGVSAGQNASFWSQLDRGWWIWVAAMCLHWIAFGPYHYGFTFLLTESGLPPVWHGWVWGLGVLTEISVFWFAGPIFDRISFRQGLFLAFGANVIRWLLTGLFPHPWVIILCQTLHGLGFALFYSAALQSIRQYGKGHQMASYQGLFSTMVGGIASMIGLSLAGFLHDLMAFHQVILWMVPVQIVALLILWRSPLSH